jgi:hypothetical protein
MPDWQRTKATILPCQQAFKQPRMPLEAQDSSKKIVGSDDACFP